MADVKCDNEIATDREKKKTREKERKILMKSNKNNACTKVNTHTHNACETK